MKAMRKVRVDGCDIHILPVVKGLVSEEEKISRAVDDLKPEAVAISISAEELDGLRNKEDYDKYEMSDLEIAYAAHLETFGEVKLPPPCYVKSLDICLERSITLIPIDMNEEAYSEAYCSQVGALDLLKESIFTSRVVKKRFDLSSPEDFVQDWDEKVNKAKGFRELEQIREKCMAEALLRLAGKFRSVLAVVECERASGVEGILKGSFP